MATVKPNIPANFNPNPNLDKSKEEINFMIDDVMDSLRNISENSTYVKGQFGNSLSMKADDFLEKANGLASFARDSFSPAVDLMKDYEDALEIVQNYDENIYNNNMQRLEVLSEESSKGKIDTLDVKDANIYLRSEDSLISEIPMTLDEYIESLNTMKSSIEQLGEHNIVAMPLRGGSELINIDSDTDMAQEITFDDGNATLITAESYISPTEKYGVAPTYIGAAFTKYGVAPTYIGAAFTKYGVSPTCNINSYQLATEKYGVAPTCNTVSAYTLVTEKYGVTPTCKNQ